MKRRRKTNVATLEKNQETNFTNQSENQFIYVVEPSEIIHQSGF